jgi:putative salt-induced outer membrane protein
MRGAAKLMWKVSDTSKFTEDFSTEVGENETVTKSVTALSAKVNGSLSTKVSYTIKNTSDVPPGFKKTDSEMAVTLVFDL